MTDKILQDVDWDDATTINKIANIISHDTTYNWKAKHRMMSCLIDLEKVLQL